MATPSDSERGASEVDLSKHGAADSGDRPDPGQNAPAPDAPRQPEAAFDPYRFGKPDRPVPPEFAPPGYVPAPPAASSPYPGPPPSTPGAPPYGSQTSGSPTSQYPYGAPPYGAPSQPPYGQYGYGAPPGYGYGTRPQTGGNGKAVTALVSGIASIVLCWLSFLDIIPVILAVVFGFLALAQAKRRNGAGRRMAVAGLACAAVGAVLAIVLSVVILRAYDHCGGLGGSNDPGFNQCVQHQL
ncbi:MAG: DUF4190 domain-containing protein [Jatrophihabitans sp.]